MSSPLHSPDYKIFRSLLIEARKASGLTQVQLAEQLGKPQSYVSKYECGERRLDFPEFVTLADIMGIDIAAFVKNYRDAISPRIHRSKKAK